MLKKEKTTLTIDPVVKRRAEGHAKRTGVSLSALVTMLLVREINLGNALHETPAKYAVGRSRAKIRTKGI
jgi:hypothetical protein